MNGVEIGDMCQGQMYRASNLPGSPIIQSIWSNKSAAIGADPCHDPLGTIRFGAMPILPDQYECQIFPTGTPKKCFSENVPGLTNENAAIKIAPGTSITIPVRLFSYGPLPKPMLLSVRELSLNTVHADAPRLTFKLDKRTGMNGDVVNLQITAPSTPFLITSPFMPQRVFSISARFDSDVAGYSGIEYPGLVVN